MKAGIVVEEEVLRPKEGRNQVMVGEIGQTVERVLVAKRGVSIVEENQVSPLHTKVDFGDNKGGSDLPLVSCVTDTSDDAVGMSVEYTDNTKNMAAKNILQTLPLDEVGVPPKWKRRV
ncbi:hypothetical protein FCV25MIE_24645 [Fagus crenata]